MTEEYTITQRDGIAVCTHNDEIIHDPSTITGPVTILVNRLNDAPLPFSLVGLDVRVLVFESCTVDLSCKHIPAVIPAVECYSCTIIGKFDTTRRISALAMDDRNFIVDVDGFNRMLDVDLFELTNADYTVAIPYSARVITCWAGFPLKLANALLRNHPECRVVDINAPMDSLQDLINFFNTHHERLDLRYYVNTSAIRLSPDIREAFIQHLRSRYNVTESLNIPSYHSMINDSLSD
jgi:hypothetical protein